MYKRKVRGWSQHTDFMFFDNLCMFLSLFIGFLVAGQPGVLSSRFFWSMVLEAVLVNLVVMIVLDTYHSVLHHSPWDEMIRLLVQTGYVVLVILVFQLLNQDADQALPKIALCTVPLYILSCYVMRQTYKSFLKKKHHILNRHSQPEAQQKDGIPRDRISFQPAFDQGTELYCGIMK